MVAWCLSIKRVLGGNGFIQNMVTGSGFFYHLDSGKTKEELFFGKNIIYLFYFFLNEHIDAESSQTKTLRFTNMLCVFTLENLLITTAQNVQSAVGGAEAACVRWSSLTLLQQ